MSDRLLYLDSSALVKLVLAEPESPALRRFLSDREHLVSSAVAAVEVVRAARRASRSKRVGSQARAVVRAVHLLAVDLKVLERAADLAPASLPSLAAIHLASALSLDDDIEAMVVYDERLAAAATTAGLAVVSPRE
jgi:predicted nucleic acid-binding protein